MNEKQRTQEGRARQANDDETDGHSDSPQATAALQQVAAVDTMIDDILSLATTSNYLDSIRQRGGQ